MSTIASTNLKHPSSAINNITLASTGAVAINGTMTGAGLDLITTQSFSSVQNVSVNNCFSSNYENYRIMMVISAASANGISISMKMRSAGTDNSSSEYNNNSVGLGTSGGASNLVAGSTTSWSLGSVGSSIVVWAISADFLRPFTNTTTYLFGNRANYAGSGEGIGGTLSAHHFGTASFDGFSITATGGSITGNLKIYGQKN